MEERRRLISMLYRFLFLVCLFGISAFGQAECPIISIVTPPNVLYPKKPETISVKFSDGRDAQKLKFVWGTSTGTFSNPFTGPTTQIVTTKDDAGKNVYFFVRVEGLPENCKDTAWEVIGVQARIDERPEGFGAVTAGLVKLRIDNFYIHMNSELSSTG